ncbi:MAG: hypothetical protein WAW73_07275 [Rhodoferax sp.]
MTNSDYIAIASAAIALLALFSTGWQAWIARHHNRLSVKPLLSWSSNLAQTPNGFEVTVLLSNNGLGPAIVTERYFTLDGLHFLHPAGPVSAIDALAGKILPEEWRCQVVAHGLPGTHTAILPGASFVIARLLFDSAVYDHQLELNKRFERVGFVVGYKDLYERRDIFKTG